MEKRRIRLNIKGVVCGLITQESDEYMQTLAKEISQTMTDVLAASPFITRESAALTIALNYCDEARKKANELKAEKERLTLFVEKATELKAEHDELLEEVERLHRKPASAQSGKAKEMEVLANAKVRAESKVSELEEENANLLKLLQSLKEKGDAFETEGAEPQSHEEKEMDTHLESLSELQKNVSLGIAEVERPIEDTTNAQIPIIGDAEQAGTLTKKADLKDPTSVQIEMKNPLRNPDFEQQGFVSFFEKSDV